MHVHFTLCVVRTRLDTSSRKEDTSRSVNLFREMFQVIDSIVTNYAHFVSVMIRVISLVLTCAPIWTRRHEHVFLNYFSMCGTLWQRCNSDLPKSMCRDSILQAKASFRCPHISASRLSSTNIAFWVDPISPFAITPLSMMSTVARSRRWGRLPVFLGSLMRSMMVLFFCTVVGRSG